MRSPVLDDKYWLHDFAVTDGDVGRVYDFLQEVTRPEKTMNLLGQVVARKLEKKSLEVDSQQRHKSAAAAKKLLRDRRARVYRQTEGYQPGEQLLVGWREDGEWHYGVGEVVVKKKATPGQPHRWLIDLHFRDGKEATYVAGANLRHPRARKEGWTLFDIPNTEDRPLEQQVDDVLRVHGASLLSHILGRLSEDSRFVLWAESCWLTEVLPDLPAQTLDQAVAYLWAQGKSATTGLLLQAVGLPGDEPHRWALNLDLDEDNRLDNQGTEAAPQWLAPLPDHLLRLSDGTLLDLSVSPNALWAKHHVLFRGPLPNEWADNPHVLTFGQCWLLDVLLVPLEDDDLTRVRDYLVERNQALSDSEILEELFAVTSRHDAFDRWRFTLSYRLSEKAKELGVEFVGTGSVWSWAFQTAPIEKPERHRRLPGTERLPIMYVSEDDVATELTRDDEPLDRPPEDLGQEWKPTRQSWEYLLTYYGWDNGVLPYNCQAREMIPPLSEGQRRGVLHFVAEQARDEPFDVTLHADATAPYLKGLGLRDFFVGHLVPGARMWVERTEEQDLYKIRYRRTKPRLRRLLFFEDRRVRPVIREVEIACEVDEAMLLAEGRFANIEALDRLDLADRRTAPKVLARLFQLIGVRDDSPGVYCARFDDLFAMLCITKPYSKAYVKQILYDRKNHPSFYRDVERGAGWFVYDPGARQPVDVEPGPDTAEKKEPLVKAASPPTVEEGEAMSEAPAGPTAEEVLVDAPRVKVDQPGINSFFTNLGVPMPLGRKIWLMLSNIWTKVQTQSICCGRVGEPGCCRLPPERKGQSSKP